MRVAVAAPVASTDPWQSAANWLANIAASQEELGRFLEDVFARLNDLLGDFVHRHRAWEADRSRAEQELQTRSQALSRREAELREEHERVRQAAGQAVAVAPGPGGDTEGISRAVAELRQERDALREAVAAAQTQMSRWAEAAGELTKVQEALVQQAKQWSGAQAPAAQPDSPPDLQEQIQRQQKELAALEQERAMLERELEIVRTRAAELSEAQAQQGRQMSEERERWSEDLKRMRRVLETVAERQLAQSAPETRAAKAAVPLPAAAEKPTPRQDRGDPVLDSVITQFEMLQRDLARRRKAAAG
jgi:DNA repair exonuclease SbcCD ATPase subunit